jgi:tetratricopeptide (TPR) repeat protein
MMRRALPLLLLLLFGCGFSNAMYNARRRLGEAERATAQGQQAAARTAYAEAMERAASEYRRHPDGGNAAEALYLVARARFGLGEFAAARAALLRALARDAEPRIRAQAHAYLGAAELSLGNTSQAAVHLDSAIATLDDAELKGRAHLWRARVRGALGDAGAWDDLERAVDAGGTVSGEAGLYAAALAVETGDSARATLAFARLFDDAGSARPDSVAAIVRSAAGRWGAAPARALLEQPRSAWRAAARDSLAIVRAELVALEGDTADAIRSVLQAADRLGGSTADGARLLAARWSLATLEDAAGLPDVRALLLPAVASASVQSLLTRLRVLDALLDDGQEGGRPLALFAAAELARDELRAPRLARSLFLSYVARDPAATWASKAALAAALLGAEAPPLPRPPTDVYLAALNGADAAGFAVAEETLARELAAIRRDAAAAAGTSDPTVGRAIALLDSARTAAHADSMRLVCGARMDSVAVAGIRADSARAACLRSDSLRFADVLRMDTLLLRDTTAARDTLRPRRGRVLIDTLRAPRP